MLTQKVRILEDIELVGAVREKAREDRDVFRRYGFSSEVIEMEDGYIAVLTSAPF